MADNGDGVEWFRQSVIDEEGFIGKRVSGNFVMMEPAEVPYLGLEPTGNLPKKRFILIRPPEREREAITGFWLRWNFQATPYEFRLFLGHWSTIEN